MGAIKTYIIHSEEENSANGTTQKSWVEMFSVLLAHMSSEISDNQNRVEALSTDELEHHVIDKSAKYILIVSPNLFASVTKTPWQNILEEAISKGVSVYKAIKYPIEGSIEPSWLKQMLAYKFYKQADDSIEEIHDFFSEEAEKSFWLSLNDITYDVLSSELPKETLCVYLAATSEDLEKSRSVVKRELQRHGYKVLPDKALSTQSAELSQQMQEDLEKCCLSIHMIGEKYGETLEDTERSMVEFQNLEASNHSKKMADKGVFFKRYIWLPNNELLADERQRFYLDRLNRDPEKQHGSEFLQNHIEDFKTVVLNYLEKEQKEEHTLEEDDDDETIANKNNRGKLLYLIVDKRDEEASISMKNWLDTQGYQVLRTDLESHKSRNARIIHQRNLNLCDGLIIFFSKATEAWLISKLQDILKSPGLGREVPLNNKAIFTDSEANEKRLEIIRSRNTQYQDALVILNKGEFLPSSLKNFLLNLPAVQEERYYYQSQQQ